MLIRRPVTDLITSRLGIGLLIDEEDYRAVAYQDSKGIWTVGFGYTIGVQEGDRTTVRKAYAQMISYVQTVEETLHAKITTDLSQNEFDALVSFVYNIGTGAFSRSTMLKKINEPSLWEASLQFDRWIYSGGKKSDGLISRRKREKAMFRGE